MSERGASKLQRRVLGVLIAVAVVSSLTATLLGSQKWDGFLLNLGTEIGGAVMTYVLLQMVIGTRTRKADLIAQMGSDVRDVAVPAADELRRQGWLTDGSLQQADLGGANLQGANLREAHLRIGLLRAAHLERADLSGANLQGGFLWEAHLQRAKLRGAHLEGAFLGAAQLERADLWGAHLQGAFLWGARLQGADLREAHLCGAEIQGVDLSTVRNLETARLDGAKANSKTQWSEGFQVPATVEMAED